MISTIKYRIFRIDAFEWLAKRSPMSMQAVVSDPPFAVLEYSPEQLLKRRSMNGGIWRLPQKYDGHERKPVPRFTVLTAADLGRIHSFHSRLAPLVFRVLTPGGHAIIASQNLVSHIVVSAFVEAGFEVRGQVVRVTKTLRGGDRPKGAHEEYPNVSVTPRSCWEPWLIFRRPCEGRVRDNLKKWGTGALRRPHIGTPFRDLIESSPARGLERKLAPHSSLKPQAFMRQIVWAALPLGQGVILDPFMGAGSTVAACEALGLESIGLEIDDEFFQLAKRSIPKLAGLPINGSERCE